MSERASSRACRSPMRTGRRLAATMLMASLASIPASWAARGEPNTAAAKRPMPDDAARGPVRVWMRDVVLYPYDDAPAQVVRLSGSVVPARAGGPIVFDDVASYAIAVQHAETRLPASSMAALMNRWILPSAAAPIREVDVTFGDGVIDMRGTLVKAGAPIPFTATAEASPTPDGDVRIRVVRMTAAGVVPKGLMDALGLTMGRVAQPRRREVFHIEGDDMIVPLASMFPPPTVRGRVRGVSVTPDAMITTIGAPHDAPSTDVPDAKSYIHYRGGSVRFARLTMADVDLTMLPDSDDGPLGFSPAQYYRQLEAGHVNAEPDRGLVVHLPDYAALTRTARDAR
jgi:hypothetical protein